MKEPIDRIAPMVADKIREVLDRYVMASAPPANEIATAIIESHELQERVEMRPAYDWTCPACGRDSFVRAITVPLTEEDLEHNDIPEGESGNFVSYPVNVTCDHCGKTFTCMGFGEDDE